jgi:hypothetical protein
VKVEFFPDSSDPREWVATFLAELLFPQRQLQAERFLWRFWRASATTEVARVLDLLLELSEPGPIVLRGAADDALSQLKADVCQTPWEAVISEFERNPQLSPRELIDWHDRRGTVHGVAPSSPDWSIIGRLVEATTARRNWEGDNLVFRNLRGPLPRPSSGRGTRISRAEPFYQLFSCQSLSVDPYVSTDAHMAYQVRAKGSAVSDWGDFDEFQTVRRHIRTKGVYSTEGNRHMLPSVIVRWQLGPQDSTFAAGFHGWIHLMDKQVCAEPILSLP